MQIRLNVQVVRDASPRPRCRRRRLLTAAALAALAVTVAVPLALAEGLITGFADVPPSNPNHDAIDRVTNAGIMTPCQTSPQLLFCPTTALGRQWAATNYDRILGLSGTPGNFVPTFKGVNVVTGGSTPPFTVDSSQKVTNLNADLLDGYDSTQVLPGAGSYSSYGGDPDATLKFLAPAASISLGTGQWALVTSSKALGTTVAGGAGALDLWICSQTGGGPLTQWGGGSFGLIVPQNTRIPMTLSAIINPGAGTHAVGLCGKTGDGNTNWNSNEWGYTTALAFTLTPATPSSAIAAASR